MTSLDFRHGLLMFSLFFLIPCMAYAHPSVEHLAGFSHGFSHPLSGWGHLLAMLAVGIWAAQQTSKKALWTLPATFIGVMILGGFIGARGIPLPWVEQEIAITVLTLGVLIALTPRWPFAISSLMVGLFALCHGHAHGFEIHKDITEFTYMGGFVVATTLLHLTGIGFAILWEKTPQWKVARFAGGVIAITGFYLLLS